MTLVEAKQKCTNTQTCAGFTVRGYTHNELENINCKVIKAEFHFKEIWKTPVHNCWASYVKEHPSPPVPPSRTTTPSPPSEPSSAETCSYGSCAGYGSGYGSESAA